MLEAEGSQGGEAVTRQELQRLRVWADTRIATGLEPQWVWYQLMKMREALDAIVGQMEAESVALGLEASLPPAVDRGPRLVVSNSASDVGTALSADDLGVLNSIRWAQ
jgi:hypothetical protein